MDLDGCAAGFDVQAFFLPSGDIKEAAYDTADEHHSAQPATDECHGERPEDQACQQASDAPIDKFTLEAFEHKGLLQPLIYSVTLHVRARKRL